MPKLTMTRIVQDIDSLDLLNYANASDRKAFLLEYCREHYGTTHVIAFNRVARAFKEAVQPFKSNDGGRFSIGMESIYR